MTTVSSPLSGRAIGLTSVPDPVFSGCHGRTRNRDRSHTGDVGGTLPVDGVVVSLHRHAFVVVDDGGRGVLTHLGIDTVRLGGPGFDLLVAKGDIVQRGQGVVRWDPSAVEVAGKSPICPAVALEATAEALSEVVDEGGVGAGSQLFVRR